jgi:hypothetical protein
LSRWYQPVPFLPSKSFMNPAMFVLSARSAAIAITSGRPYFFERLRVEVGAVVAERLAVGHFWPGAANSDFGSRLEVRELGSCSRSRSRATRIPGSVSGTDSPTASRPVGDELDLLRVLLHDLQHDVELRARLSARKPAVARVRRALVGERDAVPVRELLAQRPERLAVALVRRAVRLVALDEVAAALLFLNHAMRGARLGFWPHAISWIVPITPSHSAPVSVPTTLKPYGSNQSRGVPCTTEETAFSSMPQSFQSIM